MKVTKQSVNGCVGYFVEFGSGVTQVIFLASRRWNRPSFAHENGIFALVCGWFSVCIAL